MQAFRTWALAAAAVAGVVLPGQGLSAQAPAEEAPPPEIADKVALATRLAEAGGEGPFPAEMVSDPGLPTHTIYRPRDMAAASKAGPLPVIAWGNGACTNVGNRFRYFLTELASRGYVIVAVGPAGPGFMEWKVNLPQNADIPPEKRLPGSYAAQLTDAIDWALAENARPGSPYRGRLDPAAVAVIGQSCGGLQAISAAADRRVRTAVILNSGTFPAGSPPLAGTGDANRQSLARLRGPTLWLSGDPSDVAHKNAAGDFETVQAVPTVWAWHTGTGHSEHFREPRGGLFVPVVSDWLDWQLKGRKGKAAVFAGTDCTLCSSEGWHVSTKGF